MRKKKDRTKNQKSDMKISKQEHEVGLLESKIKNFVEEISKEFEMHHIFKEKRYITDDAIVHYRFLLKAIEKYIVNNEKNTFSDYKEQIQNQLKILEAGKKGENVTFRAIKLLGSRIRYLTNTRFIHDDIDVEIDLIVIAPTGIFAIEIKNWVCDAKLSNKGILETIPDGDTQIDIIEQIRRHSNCVYRIISQNDTKKEICRKDLKVHPIILWQNPSSKLINNFKRVPICYVNTLEYEIEDEEKYAYKYSDEDINNIYNLLLSKKESERKYKLSIPEDFFQKFVESATFELNKELELKRNKLNSLYKKQNEPLKYYGKKMVNGIAKGSKIAMKIIEISVRSNS